MGKVFGFIVLIALIIFAGPAICLIGWNCAREAWPTLPQLSYWQVFWIANSIELLFKASTSRSSD